ncbi:MAG: FAD-binding oxidoreductase [Parachlamydia sp.]|nr:FAD-binding oxidoreductase [Parachlamydia sp.]
MSTTFSLASRYAAVAVDRLQTPLASKCQTFLRREVLSRIIATVVFPIFAALDALGYAIQGACCLVAAPFKGMAPAKRALMHVYMSSVAALTSPLSLVTPDLVTYHYLKQPHPDKLPLKDFGNIYATREASPRYPRTVDEVAALIREAKAKGLKVTVAGARYAQGGHILPSAKGIVIDTQKLNKVSVDPRSKKATVQAGATWDDVQMAANRHGLAVKCMQASNIFSIGGSLSANVHAWDHQGGTLSDGVSSLTLVMADGSIKVAKPGDPLFRHAIGGYGLFGVIVEATIELADNELLEKRAVEIAAKDYARYYEEKVGPNPNVVLHCGRLSIHPKMLFDKVIAVNYSKIARTTSITPLQPEHSRRLGRIGLHVLRRMSWTKYIREKIEKQAVASIKRVTRNQAMRPHIRFIYNPSESSADFLQEYFIPKGQFSPFISELKETMLANRVNVINATIRHVKKDTQTALPYALEDCFSLVIYFNQSLARQELEKTRKWTQALVEKASARGGRYYLPYHRFPSLEQFRKVYPEHRAFQASKQAFDPAGMFSSQFYKHYFDGCNSR